MRFLLFLPLTVIFACQPAVKNQDWPVYGGDHSASRYSTLDQITPQNVAQLQVAWTYHSGDNKPDSAEIQCSPIVVNGTLYATSPKLKVVALDAATGKERWTFDPFLNRQPQLHANRGVAYWAAGDDERILFSAGSHLYALNARTGQPIPTFGQNGAVDLHEGLDKDVADLYVIATTPGVVYKNLYIIGSRVSENADAAPGHVRAFDVRTGKRAWIFHTIPQPGERGYDTWPPDAWKTVGGANTWAGMSLDEKRGLLFLPTGSPSYDFYGANRKGENLFGNCILALEAATGKYVWHFQTVHHDVWDLDLPAPPNLVTVTHDGKKVDAVAQTTKSGYVFLLDRETGKPLFPVEERPFPASDMPGEQTWPTQPIPVKPRPFARQIFTEADITTISSEAHAAVRERFAKIRSNGQFVPPSREGTVIFPGFDGGAEWGGAAATPDGMLYLNANEMPWILTMVDATTKGNEIVSVGQKLYTANCAVCHGVDRMGDQHSYPSLVGIEKRLKPADVQQLLKNGKGRMRSFQHVSDADRTQIVDFLFNLPAQKKTVPTRTVSRSPENESTPPPYIHTGYHRFLDPNGYPAVKPPWGTLNAINLNTGEIAWQVPLGEFSELTKRGIPPTGTENYGGPVATKSGLIFIGATQDKKFRAFDQQTGKVVWETTLPAGGYATPCTYQVNGKQYVVIAAGGVKMKSTAGDAYVAFALPD